MLPPVMSPTRKQPEKQLSIKEVATQLGENAETVKGWRRRGLFPHAVRVDTPRGPVWQIPSSDLENFTKPARGRPSKTVKKSRAR